MRSYPQRILYEFYIGGNRCAGMWKLAPPGYSGHQWHAGMRAHEWKLIKKFMAELEWSTANICAWVSQIRVCAGRQPSFNWKRVQGDCRIVPPGPHSQFNSGHYDLNVIKEHFVELLADTAAKVQVGKKANKMIHEDQQLLLCRPHQLSLARHELW